MDQTLHITHLQKKEGCHLDVFPDHVAVLFKIHSLHLLCPASNLISEHCLGKSISVCNHNQITFALKNPYIWSWIIVDKLSLFSALLYI